jgi:protein-S-isoprenylcysteine O-methyltransferase Ste14
MPVAVRWSLIILGAIFLVIGMYHRIVAAKAGQRLDRTREGWPTLIGMRMAGLATFGVTIAWLWNPPWFSWAALPVPDMVRWSGVVLFATSISWLVWMFVSLGRNLTDTVVTRPHATFVNHGPYQYVRNPMYSGLLLLGFSLGLAFGTWLLPLAATVMFVILARRTRIEEEYLLARFGDPYRNYMTRVGRFFPRFGGIA